VVSLPSARGAAGAAGPGKEPIAPHSVMREFLGNRVRRGRLAVHRTGNPRLRPARAWDSAEFLETKRRSGDMGQIERRDLLRYAGAAALGSLGAKAAINVVRTGLFGTGHSHVNAKLKTMKNSPDNYEVVSAYEPDERIRSRNQKEPLFQGLKWVSEDELLGDPSINLIVVECRAWKPCHGARK